MDTLSNEVTEMKTRVFKVPTENISALNVKVAELNKKAVKLGCPMIRVVLGDLVVEENEENETFTEYRLLTVEGEAPSLRGWSFIGKLEPSEAGTIVKSIPGAKIPTSYFSVDATHCDHCKTTRARKETFIVKRGEEHMQLGRSCLKDFLGHQNPEAIAAYAELLIDFEDDFKKSSKKKEGGAFVTDLVRTMAVSLAAIRRDGFHNSSHDYPTKFMMFGFFMDKNPTQLVVSPADESDALLAIDWIKAKAETTNDEFWMNLGKYVSLKTVGLKQYGYIAAAAMMWIKSMGELSAREKLAAGVNDSAIGPDGTKVVLEAEVISAHQYQGASFAWNDSGIRAILMMKTTAGNLVKMFTSNLSIAVGDAVKISGRLGECERESFEASPYKGKCVTKMAPRARLTRV